MLSGFSCVWFFATLWTVTHQVPLCMKSSRQEYRSGLPFPSPGDLPNPGIESTSLMSLALPGRFLTTSTTWEALPTLFVGVIPLSTFLGKGIEAWSSPFTAPSSHSMTEAGFALRWVCALICCSADLPFETHQAGSGWLFLNCQMNKALGNCLIVTVMPREQLLNRNKESQTAASWSNDLPFLGLASTSITWIKFESRAMFLLDPGSYLEYRKYLAIYRCHKLLTVCCGKQRMGPGRNLSIWSKAFHPFLAPVCTLVIFYKSRKNKFKQIFLKEA